MPVAQVVRFLSRRGKDVVIQEFGAGTKNAYEDAAVTPETPRTVRALVELLENPVTMRKPSGVEVAVDARVVVADGTEPAAPATDEQMPLLTTDRSSFLVVEVGPEQNGSRTLHCESRR